MLTLTSASRGLGLKLTGLLAARTKTVIYAGLRSFSPATCDDLAALTAKSPKSVIPIQLTSADETNHPTGTILVAKLNGKVV